MLRTPAIRLSAFLVLAAPFMAACQRDEKASSPEAAKPASANAAKPSASDDAQASKLLDSLVAGNLTGFVLPATEDDMQVLSEDAAQLSAFERVLKQSNAEHFLTYETAKKQALRKGDVPENASEGVSDLPLVDLPSGAALNLTNVEVDATPAREEAPPPRVVPEPIAPQAVEPLPGNKVEPLPIDLPLKPFGRPDPAFPIIIPPFIPPFVPPKPVKEVCYRAEAVVYVVVTSVLQPQDTWIGPIIWGGGIGNRQAQDCFPETMPADKLAAERQGLRNAAVKFAKDAARETAQQFRKHYCDLYRATVQCKEPRPKKDEFVRIIVKRDRLLPP